MLDNVVFLKDVLKEISQLNESGKAPVFSVSFRTLNRNSKTGGKLITYEKAKLAIKEKKTDSTSFKSLAYAKKNTSGIKRNPRHFDNKTRNLIVLPQGKIRKVHINHIIEYNGKKVVY
jgi:hypothetical protein